MADIAEIEASIQTLPEKEFFLLLGWMAERHLEILSAENFELPELEIELAKVLESPRHVLDEGFFDKIRMMAATVS